MSQVGPVLGTSTAAHLGWFVADELWFSSGHWAVRERNGTVYDGRSGYRIDALKDLWGGFSRDREQLWFFRRLAPNIRGAFLFDVFTRERVREKVLCGAMAEHMVTGLDRSRLVRWGGCGPLANVWSRIELAGSLRVQMPASRRHLTRGECGEPMSIQVSRIRIGLLEHTRGLVPTDGYGRPDGFAEGVPLTMHPAITEAPEGPIGEFRPNLATISYNKVVDQDGSSGQIASRRRMNVPLAVLIGTPAVQDLGIDVTDLSVNHDVTPLGLRQTPNLLVRFSGGDGLWYQLVAFAHDLNQERLVAMLAIELDGTKPGEETREQAGGH